MNQSLRADLVRSFKRTIVALALCATTATAQSAPDACKAAGVIPLSASEPAAKITVYPPLPEPLALRGVAIIPYCAENLHLAPVFGPDAVTVKPRVGHIHARVDDTSWVWADSSGQPIILQGLLPGPHKLFIDLVDANHHALDKGVVAFVVPQAPRSTDKEVSPIFGVTIPPGYRDWRLISVAHEEGDLNDLRAILGNDIAIEALREGRQTFPDGTIIARLAWSYVQSQENNKAFGRAQSFVAGAPTNGVQFMVKDSTQYAATGGWGFAQFNEGKAASETVHKTCFACHEAAKGQNFVFTHYAR